MTRFFPKMPGLSRDAAVYGLWLVGAAILVAVIVSALYLSEWRESCRFDRDASPWWIVLALVLQAATYLAQGEVFRGVPRAAGSTLPRQWLYRLSLTKLFLDQALPSAGMAARS